jgi:tetratricopeptide (TPR) repeat protein
VFNAMSQFHLGNLEAAEASAREGVKLDRAHVYPDAEYTLGVILGARGDYKGAAEHLRNYLLLAPNSPNAETVRKQLARAEELAAARPAGGQATPQQPSP